MKQHFFPMEGKFYRANLHCHSTYSDGRRTPEALKAGNFYASMGPEIEDMYIEDGFLTVKTSPTAKITLTTGVRQARVAYPTGDNATFTEAKFDLSRI